MRTNMALAAHGLKFGPGLGIGMTLERLVREGLLKKDMILAARILTSAASDARMSGEWTFRPCPLPGVETRGLPRCCPSEL